MEAEMESVAELSGLIHARIENLRPKLLDLSRRNPLISTSLSPRNKSLIRVVDELPDVLAFRLGSQKQMRFVPLPPLDDDPRDEQRQDFQNTLASARFTDETYLQAYDALDPNEEGSLEAGRRLERELKDRVRASLGMAARQQKTDVSLSQHAINNGISPHYELPGPEHEHEDGRHADNDIQTLLLPEELERRLNGLMSKCRTWEQETGMNALHAAFGFLEWSEQEGTASSFAPLVLLPVRLEKYRTRNGTEFWINADGNDTELNFVIAEKLQREFGVELPKFCGESVEDYLKEVAANPPKMLKWRMRRQVAFGIFPSSRMAMYHDLNPSIHDFEKNEIINNLLGGSDAIGGMPFADEYDVDRPEIEAKAPFLVLEADSSQFSTIVDVSEGKNLAVEGPPGTGKSQTIVNTIANAIGQGKKVLFVAAKTAALEVVKSRLEAVGIGEYLLPLQAARSMREQVVESARKRLEMDCAPTPPDIEARITAFRQVRSELAVYIEVISEPLGSTSLKTYDVLGKAIASAHLLQDMPQSLQIPRISGIENFDRLQLEFLQTAAHDLAQAWLASTLAPQYWSGLSVCHLNPITALQLAEHAHTASKAYNAVTQSRLALDAYALPHSISIDQLNIMLQNIKSLQQLSNSVDRDLLSRIWRSSQGVVVKDFIYSCGQCRSKHMQLSQIVTDPTDNGAPDALREVEYICRSHGIRALDSNALQKELVLRRDTLASKKRVYDSLKSFMELFPKMKAIPLEAIAKSRQLISATDREVLAMRSTVTADTVTATLIKEWCQTGRKLKEEKERLASVVSLAEDLPIAELRTYVETLRNAGMFSWLSSAYRKAKRTYLAYSRRSGFNKEDAAKDLQDLAEWKTSEQRFAEDQLARKIFGVHFKAAETNFDLFERLAAYSIQVDTLFGGLPYRDIRALLKTGDSDILISIPEFPLDDDFGTFAELETEIGRQEAQLCLDDEAYTRLATLLPRLICPTEKTPDSLTEVADHLERLVTEKKELDENTVARAVLDNKFHGHETDPELFAGELNALAILERESTCATILVDLFEADRLQDALQAVEQIVACEADAASAIATLERQSGVPFRQKIKDNPDKDASQFLFEASKDREGMHTHSTLASARAAIAGRGLGWIPEVLEQNDRPLSNLGEVFAAVIWRAMAIKIYEKHGPVLSHYSGARLDERRAALARLDREILSLTRQHLRHIVRQMAKPPEGIGRGKKSEWTEMALIENEISKSKRFISVRDLTRRAGDALLALKPCWMMSPMAVAQYLPHKVLFDLCIIDEASQMPPEDAMGALSRSHRAMVVGDTNQLPPTSFFRKMLVDEEVDEDETVLDESILEMANGMFRPARRLRWHYRSRHSGLIQFSNQHVYDNNLVVFPSPTESRSDMGVSLVKVEGRYSSGVNSDEAAAMIDATLRFMRTTPNRSLGLVTLNQKQRDLLQENIERELSRNAVAARYVEYWNAHNDGLEAFFIKNLENVQGDERDVIFIGTVYGPERLGGTPRQNFGPINGLAGKRRLNVLFSRAKEQIVTFSSLMAADIRADAHTNPGVFMLKNWLEYSATGRIHAGEFTGMDPESDFEEHVIDQLRSIGCEPVPQVGVAGYRIDIGIRHQMWPHGFIMGVECDGATYHSARSARDRDRLREEVLRNLGWKLYRIWSTDWFNDPVKETQKLRIAIEERLHELQQESGSLQLSETVLESLDTPDTRFQEDDVLTTILPDNLDEQDAYDTSCRPSPAPTTAVSDTIDVGDTVTIRYVGCEDERVVTLSGTVNDPGNGITHIDTPLGMALLGAEQDEEIEILIGNKMRRAVIKHVEKAPPDESAYAKALSKTQTKDDRGEEVGFSRIEGRFDPNRFYDHDYLSILRPVACRFIDDLGPITFRHLSEIIARAHGFQRTGVQIRRQVEAAISQARRASKAPDGDTTLWPDNLPPTVSTPFRGLVVNGEKRVWHDVPYPEKLGLAIEIVQQQSKGDLAGMMSSRIGLGRLRQATRSELEILLEEAQKYIS